MKHLNIDQRIQVALWPILTVLFINTFGMLWYSLSGFNSTLAGSEPLALSFDTLFRVILLIISLAAGYGVYDMQKRRMSREVTKDGHYNMKGKGPVGFIMHILLGLVEATFAFFTFNTFWLIVNFTDASGPLVTDLIYLTGFGFSILMAGYLLTRQTAFAFLAAQRRP
jgi:hypothetical protein